MTVGEARNLLKRPVFGKDDHIRAVSILSVLEELDIKGNTLEDVDIDIDCPKCDGYGACSHCDQDCGDCDGTGKVTGNITKLDDLDEDKLREMMRSRKEQEAA